MVSTKNNVATVIALTAAAGSVAAQQCQCVTSQVVVAYTVAVANGVTSTIGASIPTAAPANNAPVPLYTNGQAACSFPLLANNQFPLGQIADGQIQAVVAGLPQSTFTLVNGQVFDQAGRICEISGQGQAQFQCNYAPTTGATVTGFGISNGLLTYQGSTQFYGCQLGQAGQGYNIYAQLTGAQSNCQAVTLTAQGSNACPAPSASAPLVVVPTAAPAPVTGTPPAGGAATTSTRLPTASPTIALPVSNDAAPKQGSSLVATVVGGFAVALASLLM